MKILIDGRTIVDNPSGVGYVVISLLKELVKHREFEFVVLTRKGVTAIPGLPQLKTYQMDRDYQFVGFNRFQFEQYHLPKIIDQVNPDIVHLTDSFGLPMLRDKSKKYLITLHDLIPMTKYRELMTKVGGIFYDISIRLSVNGADKVVCISDFTKRDLFHFFPKVDTNKIDVIQNGVDFFDEKPNDDQVKGVLLKFGIEHPYFFYVGGFSPRKNTLNLIKSFMRFNQKHDNKYQLVLAGRMSQKLDIVRIIAKMKEFIRLNALEKSVKLLGYVSIKEKFALMSGSIALTYLSNYEGFGLPVIEAFSVGTAVITSRGSAMKELAGENALYADPNNIDDMEKSFGKMIDQHEVFVGKAKSSVALLKKKYNWIEAAKQYAEVYRELYGSKK